MFNVEKQNTIVVPCILVFKFISSHLCSSGLLPSFADASGFQLPCDLVLQTLPSIVLNAELPRPRQHNPSPKSEAECLNAHLKCPGYVNPKVVFVKCCELPQKERILLQQIQLLLRSFSCPCSFRIVVVARGGQSLARVFSKICLGSWKLCCI